MKITDAAQILELSGSVTPQDVKRAYRSAAMKYHPDRNPAGAEMMKIVNAAYDVLKDYTGDIEHTDSTGQAGERGSYPEALSEALNAVFGLEGLEIEICGAWVWLHGNTYTHRAALKETGFRYASKKKSWYFRPEDWRSSSRGQYSMDDIRDKYGSNRPHMPRRDRLAAGRAVSD